MKLRSVFFMMLASMVLSACQAVEPLAPVAQKESGQVITVQTPGVAGAHCFARAGALSYPLRTPGQIRIDDHQGDSLDITCFKGEHMVGSQILKRPCYRCHYPATVVIAMQLDGASMRRDVEVLR